MRETAAAAIYGLGGGFLATVLFIALGVSVTNAGAAYLWLAAILLMLFHPRFLCFAYAGSLVSILNLLFGYPPRCTSPRSWPWWPFCTWWRRP